MPLPVPAALDRALAVLVPVLDVALGRVGAGEPPAWCEARGWAEFLLSLTDDELLGCEAHGLAAVLPSIPRAPATLGALARDVALATAMPRLAAAPRALDA